MLTFEEFESIYSKGPQATYQLFVQLYAQIEELKLQANEVVALKLQNQQLTDRLAKLEERLAKDSHNSHKPPSSDRVKPKPKSLRKPSQKKPGAQKGHPGHHLHVSDSVDQIYLHKVFKCAHCQTSLLEEPVQSVESRQVYELPPLKLEVHEYRAEEKLCPNCFKTTKATFPEGVKRAVQYGNNLKSVTTYLHGYQLIPYKRVSQFFEDLFGHRLSLGLLVNAEKECHQKLKPSEEVTKSALIKAAIVSYDESGLQIEKKRNWLHTACTEKLTAYFPHAKRGEEGMSAFGILPYFQGIAIHDHWKAYFRYSCVHGLCNTHHLRELTFLEEEQHQIWAKEMKEYLLCAKKRVEEERIRSPALSEEELLEWHKHYEEILQRGIQENPELPKIEGKRGRTAQTKGRNLINRFKEFKEAVLRFLSDFSVPFSNNQGERDIRMVKVQQKISGTFRSWQGARRFCRLRGYISTAQKHKLKILDSIKKAFEGNPFIPCTSY